MRLCVALLGLCGCNQLFGLENTVQNPAVDAAINCAINPKDPLFHDEDHDGYADLCDNCPGIANPDQANRLEEANLQAKDQVGDICDPAPDLPGDTIAAFISFDEPGAISSWSPLNGSWRIVDGQMIIDATQAFDYQTIKYLGATTPLPGAVEVHAVIDKIEAANRRYVLGIIPNLTTDPQVKGTGECSMVRSWTGTSQDPDTIASFIQYGNGGGNGVSSPIAPSKIADGAGYVGRVAISAHTLACRFVGDQGDQGAVTNTDDLIGGKVALDVLGIAARFDYVVMYGHE